MATSTRHSYIRWALVRDVPEIVELTPGGWTADDYLGRLRERNCICMVLEHGGEVLGAVVYELHKGRLEILNVATRPDCRRLGIAAALMDRMVYKCASHRRDFIAATVPEDNLAAQLFFRACGFWAVAIGTGGYVMERYVMRDECGRVDEGE